MKFTTKLILPIAVLSLSAASVFAGEQPKIKAPFLGNLLVVSACNMAAGIASVVAIQKYIPDHHFPLKPLSTIVAIGYWIHEEFEAIEDYNKKERIWKAYQIVNSIK